MDRKNSMHLNLFDSQGLVNVNACFGLIDWRISIKRFAGTYVEILTVTLRDSLDDLCQMIWKIKKYQCSENLIYFSGGKLWYGLKLLVSKHCSFTQRGIWNNKSTEFNLKIEKFQHIIQYLKITEDK